MRDQFRPGARLALVAFGVLLLLTPALTQTGPPRSPFDSLHFRDIGPAASGGRIHDLQIDPKDPAVLYVGAASGGIWKSTNKGLTWRDIFGKQPDNTFGALAIFEGDSQIIWAGSGENNHRQSSSWGGGVYRSTNAGETWTYLGLHDTRSIGRVVLHPADPNVAYIAAVGNLWRGNPERGVYKTTDAGKTWSKILFVDGGQPLRQRLAGLISAFVGSGARTGTLSPPTATMNATLADAKADLAAIEKEAAARAAQQQVQPPQAQPLRGQSPDVGQRPTTPNDPLPTLDFDKYFTGRWTFDWDMPESPFGPEGHVTGTEIYKRVADGRFESDIEAKGPQGAFKAHAVITYDRAAKTIARAETDSRGFSIQESGKVGADNGGAFTIYYDSAPFSYAGKQLRLKLTKTMTSPLFYRVRVQLSVDGGPFTSLGFPWWKKEG